MLKTLTRHVRRLIHGSRKPQAPLLPRPEVLDRYVAGAPSAALMADLFQDQWVSKLPPEMGNHGHVGLFDDVRLHEWLARVPVAGKTVLELGPLEGGHTTQLVRAGAAEVTAVEGNALAFLKCLVVKEALGLTNARFLLGDIPAFLRERRHSFDVGVACGVLYHMQNPVELIELLAHSCQHVFLWTHYYDGVVANNPEAASHLREPQVVSWKGFRHSVIRYDYANSLAIPTFCGGSAPSAFWLPRVDLLKALEYFGLGKIQILRDEPHHINGPSMSLIASR